MGQASRRVSLHYLPIPVSWGAWGHGGSSTEINISFLHGETQNTARSTYRRLREEVGPEEGLATLVPVELNGAELLGQAGGRGLSGFRDGQAGGQRLIA